MIHNPAKEVFKLDPIIPCLQKYLLWKTLKVQNLESIKGYMTTDYTTETDLTARQSDFAVFQAPHLMLCLWVGKDEV